MPALVYKFQEQEHRFPLKDRVSIGRARDNDLCVPSDSISSLHAVIKRDGEGYQLEDAGSSNGIVVAGRRVLSCPLHSGDVFALGDVEFAFTVDGAEAAGAEAPAETPLPAPSEAVIAQFKEARERVLGEMGKVIVGQQEVLNQMLVALFARGHCLLIGVPGLAKTLMVRTLGSAMDLESRRIQFTPDLMPSDITGTDILEEDAVTGKRAFRFHRGPIFTNLLLADEINRTPPKTQAALLEAMQEQRVTISGTSYDLPSPFMVLATQNPIEQEGTYPLPEAQLDRFMFCVHLAYPSAHEEQRVILDTTRQAPAAVSRVLNAAQVLQLQQLVRQVPVSQHVALYALSLVRATRPNCQGSLDFVNRWVNWGAGTRAGQYLLLAAKTHVLLQGRFSVSCADVREYALPVLRHRIFPTFTAASEAVTTDQIVKKVVAAVKEPQY
jgi:MoxR-like ATPase